MLLYELVCFSKAVLFLQSPVRLAEEAERNKSMLDVLVMSTSSIEFKRCASFKSSQLVFSNLSSYIYSSFATECQPYSQSEKLKLMGFCLCISQKYTG